ncbi:MAG: PEP-CTERM sorting domain-containing protein [Planctomycetia bacterium]|nr:PEP-CTERM sorting domain-containing protein [Planctomycetia bacterium]MCC7314627.1 PEP-CTERM sorting domain-containing protein [Planctomycetota bacterium]
MQLRKTLVFIIILSTGFIAPTAEAQFSSLQQFLFQSFRQVGDRTASIFPGGGPLFDNNIFDQAIRYNRTGDGWTYEEFRFFGPDSFNNPNSLDLGPLKIQLGADATLLGNPQPVGIHNSVGYTTALIPEVSFRSQTGQRAFNVFSGQTNFSPVPINYEVTMNTGIQDYQWSGNILVDANGRMNALGFYDLDMRVMNVGQSTADGLVVHDEQVTDFDTGPINISGNIMFDALASLAQGLGQTEAAAFPRAISGASGDINSSKAKVEEIMARIRAGEPVSDEDMSFIMQQMFVTAFLNDPLGFMQNGLPDVIPGFEGLELAVSEEQPEPATNTNVPEPGTLILLGSAAAITSFIKRRRKVV